MKLTITVATRSRPKMVREVVETMLSNIEHPETVLMVSADEDDKETLEALKGYKYLSVEPRPDTVAEKWNRAQTFAPADIYMPTVDTVTFNTKGFDRKVLEAASLFPDGIGCVYLPMANASFPMTQCLTAGLVKRLGYIYPPYFPFWFVDHWVDDICRMIGRISFADIECDASRRNTQKTIGLRDLDFWTTFYDAGTLHRRALAHSIILDEEFRDEEWRKMMLINQHPMHEIRSFNINHHVRENAESIEFSRGGQESLADARYKRIKAQAEGMLHRVVEEAA